MPSCLPMASAVRRLSPVRSTHVDAEFFELSDGVGAGGLHRVGQGQHPQEIPVRDKEQGRLALLGDTVGQGVEGGEVHPLLLKEATVAGKELPPLHRGLHAAAGSGGKVSGFRKCNIVYLYILHNGLGQGVFREDLREPARRSSSASSTPSAGNTSVTWGFPSVTVPVLSQHHGVDVVEDLQGLGGLDEDAVLGGLAGAHHDGHRGGPAPGHRGRRSPAPRWRWTARS